MVFIAVFMLTFAWFVAIVSLIDDGDLETLGLTSFLTLFIVGALLI